MNLCSELQIIKEQLLHFNDPKNIELLKAHAKMGGYNKNMHYKYCLLCTALKGIDDLIDHLDKEKKNET